MLIQGAFMVETFWRGLGLFNTVINYIYLKLKLYGVGFLNNVTHYLRTFYRIF